MNNLEFLVFSSPSFMNKTRICLDSIKKFHPESAICLKMMLDPKPNETYVDGLARKRLEKLRDMLVENPSRTVVLLGADCVLYDNIDGLREIMDESSIIITPHVINPPKEHTAQLYKTGHVNADLIVVNRNSLPILEWLLEQKIGYYPDEGIFYEQTWLSALPFIFHDVHILKNPGFNLAYFNIHEREIVDYSNMVKKYVVKHDGQLDWLSMIQFSGYEKGMLGKFSKHYNGMIVNELLLQLIEEYDRML